MSKRLQKWYDRSFEGLSVGEMVEFFKLGVDPNSTPNAEPRWEGPVEVKTEPTPPGPQDGDPNGLMVRAGKDALRVRSDEYGAWYRQGGYKPNELR